MDTITWVGINHYVPEEELGAYLDSLKEGDVVRLVPEPENFWDKRAIAVFHRFIMRGHISRYETEVVHLMAKHGADMVGRITDDVDCEQNQVKITIDSVKVAPPEDDDYPRLAPSALGMEVNPHIMYEEYSYRQMREEVDGMVQVIRKNDLDSPLVSASVETIVQTLQVYLGIWDRSISLEANRLPRYFDQMLTNLSAISPTIKDALRPTLQQLRRCTAMQPKADNILATFCRQLENLDAYYAAPGGLYARYDEHLGDQTDAMRERLEAICQWLDELTEERRSLCNGDIRSFVHTLYCHGYKADDLYMIITHLLVMRRLAVRLYNLPCDASLRSVIENRTVNVFGSVSFHSEGQMHIEKVIKNNGLISV